MRAICRKSLIVFIHIIKKIIQIQEKNVIKYSEYFFNKLDYPNFLKFLVSYILYAAMSLSGSPEYSGLSFFFPTEGRQKTAAGKKTAVQINQSAQRF